MKRKYKVIITMTIIVIGYILYHLISICVFSTKDQVCPADVAIILGASTANGNVSPVYQERINHGIELYHSGYVKRIMVTGGIGKGNKESDAEAAKQYAIREGMSEANILIEETSTITQENLQNAKEIMDTYGYSTAIIVSDPLHMKRAMLLAKDVGIVAYSSPTPTTKYVTMRTKLPFLAREVFFLIGYKWYRLFESSLVMTAT